MPIVKPPTFNELVKTYGSPKAAVLHLLKSGFSPEQIQWKMAVSYQRIRLYIEGTEPKKASARLKSSKRLMSIFNKVLAAQLWKEQKNTSHRFMKKFLGFTTSSRSLDP